eukprot:1160066-Pelagomonas_calceolata.AAC.9
MGKAAGALTSIPHNLCDWLHRKSKRCVPTSLWRHSATAEPLLTCKCVPISLWRHNATAAPLLLFQLHREVYK